MIFTEHGSGQIILRYIGGIDLNLLFPGQEIRYTIMYGIFHIASTAAKTAFKDLRFILL
jgi:hypothetical protein